MWKKQLEKAATMMIAAADTLQKEKYIQTKLCRDKRLKLTDPIKFEINEPVMLDISSGKVGWERKLSPKFSLNWKIKKMIKPYLYQIENTKDKTLKVVNVARLAKWYTRI